MPVMSGFRAHAIPSAAKKIAGRRERPKSGSTSFFQSWAHDSWPVNVLLLFGERQPDVAPPMASAVKTVQGKRGTARRAYKQR